MKILVTVLVSLALTFGILGCAPKDEPKTTPETPAVPEKPEVPETPEAPEKPETPETPETPEVPAPSEEKAE